MTRETGRSNSVRTSCSAGLVALSLFVVAPRAAAAEPASPPQARERMTITTSAVTPLFGAYEVEATMRASGSLGVVVNASYLTLEEGDWKARAGTVGAGLNYYFLGSALRRWYVGAIGELWFSSWRHEPSRERASLQLGYALLAVAGYTFVWDGGPVVDLGAGVVAFHVPSAHLDLAEGPVSSGAVTKVYPALKVNLGWAF